LTTATAEMSRRGHAQFDTKHAGRCAWWSGCQGRRSACREETYVSVRSNEPFYGPEGLLRGRATNTFLTLYRHWRMLFPPLHWQQQ